MDQNQPELRNYSGHLRKLSELPALQGGRQSFEERYRNLRVFVRFAGPKGQNVNSPGCDPGSADGKHSDPEGVEFPALLHSASRVGCSAVLDFYGAAASFSLARCSDSKPSAGSSVCKSWLM